MGEAKRRKEAGEPLLRWQKVTDVPPPQNSGPLIVQVRVTCLCMLGGRIAMSAARVDGEWVINSGGFEHSFEVEAWLRLPPFIGVLN